jgi:exodeoxyribonuclease-1
MTKTFYWHDYETFGVDPRRDRPVQFAGIRTDEDFNIIGDPLVVYCKPARDVLPHPEACLVTGIIPQLAEAEGVVEAEFFKLINAEFSQSGTTALGYNTLRFDDEVTRFGFFRNFIDPYAREWKNGNSRWDIIDMARVTYALRPDGINWPMKESGVPSFRLEELTAANGISHESAHDALSDVYATIAMAKLIRDKQPRLYDFLNQHRDKQWVLNTLNWVEKKPVLHTSSRYGSAIGNTSMVAPVARDAKNKNAIWVYDLRHDPSDFQNMDAIALAECMFSSRDELDKKGMVRFPVKQVHANRAPVIAPISTLTPEAAERIQLDKTSCMKNLEILQSWGELPDLLLEAANQQVWPEPFDPEQTLYSGAFFSDTDRRTMEQVLEATPEDLATGHYVFDDRRLPEMLFRYRARNWPETLNESELEEWEAYRVNRLTSEEAGAGITVSEFDQRIEDLGEAYMDDDQKMEILEQLVEYRQELI